MLCSRSCKNYHRLSNGGRQPELFLEGKRNEKKSKSKSKKPKKTKVRQESEEEEEEPAESKGVYFNPSCETEDGVVVTICPCSCAFKHALLWTKNV